MSGFVVASLAIVVAVLAVTGVVAVRLAGMARSSAADVGRATERLRPLAQELGDEAAVTQTELAALQDRTSRRAEQEGPRRAE